MTKGAPRSFSVLLTLSICFVVALLLITSTAAQSASNQPANTSANFPNSDIFSVLSQPGSLNPQSTCSRAGSQNPFDCNGTNSCNLGFFGPDCLYPSLSLTPAPGSVHSRYTSPLFPSGFFWGQTVDLTLTSLPSANSIAYFAAQFSQKGSTKFLYLPHTLSFAIKTVRFNINDIITDPTNAGLLNSNFKFDFLLEFAEAGSPKPNFNNPTFLGSFTVVSPCTYMEDILNVPCQSDVCDPTLDPLATGSCSCANPVFAVPFCNSAVFSPLLKLVSPVFSSRQQSGPKGLNPFAVDGFRFPAARGVTGGWFGLYMDLDTGVSTSFTQFTLDQPKFFSNSLPVDLTGVQFSRNQVRGRDSFPATAVSWIEFDLKDLAGLPTPDESNAEYFDLDMLVSGTATDPNNNNMLLPFAWKSIPIRFYSSGSAFHNALIASPPHGLTCLPQLTFSSLVGYEFMNPEALPKEGSKQPLLKSCPCAAGFLGADCQTQIITPTVSLDNYSSGYVVGQTYVFELQTAEGRLDRVVDRVFSLENFEIAGVAPSPDLIRLVRSDDNLVSDSILPGMITSKLYRHANSEKVYLSVRLNPSSAEALSRVVTPLITFSSPTLLQLVFGNSQFGLQILGPKFFIQETLSLSCKEGRFGSNCGGSATISVENPSNNWGNRKFPQYPLQVSARSFSTPFGSEYKTSLCFVHITAPEPQLLADCDLFSDALDIFATSPPQDPVFSRLRRRERSLTKSPFLKAYFLTDARTGTSTAINVTFLSIFEAPTPDRTDIPPGFVGANDIQCIYKNTQHFDYHSVSNFIKLPAGYCRCVDSSVPSSLDGDLLQNFPRSIIDGSWCQTEIFGTENAAIPLVAYPSDPNVLRVYLQHRVLGGYKFDVVASRGVYYLLSTASVETPATSLQLDTSLNRLYFTVPTSTAAGDYNVMYKSTATNIVRKTEWPLKLVTVQSFFTTPYNGLPSPCFPTTTQLTVSTITPSGVGFDVNCACSDGFYGPRCDTQFQFSRDPLGQPSVQVTGANQLDYCSHYYMGPRTDLGKNMRYPMEILVALATEDTSTILQTISIPHCKNDKAYLFDQVLHPAGAMELKLKLLVKWHWSGQWTSMRGLFPVNSRQYKQITVPPVTSIAGSNIPCPPSRFGSTCSYSIFFPQFDSLLPLDPLAPWPIPGLNPLSKPVYPGFKLQIAIKNVLTGTTLSVSEFKAVMFSPISLALGLEADPGSSSWTVKYTEGVVGKPDPLVSLPINPFSFTISVALLTSPSSINVNLDLVSSCIYFEHLKNFVGRADVQSTDPQNPTGLDPVSSSNRQCYALGSQNASDMCKATLPQVPNNCLCQNGFTGKWCSLSTKDKQSLSPPPQPGVPRSIIFSELGPRDDTTRNLAINAAAELNSAMINEVFQAFRSIVYEFTPEVSTTPPPTLPYSYDDSSSLTFSLGQSSSLCSATPKCMTITGALAACSSFGTDLAPQCVCSGNNFGSNCQFSITFVGVDNPIQLVNGPLHNTGQTVAFWGQTLIFKTNAVLETGVTLQFLSGASTFGLDYGQPSPVGAVMSTQLVSKEGDWYTFKVNTPAVPPHLYSNLEGGDEYSPSDPLSIKTRIAPSTLSTSLHVRDSAGTDMMRKNVNSGFLIHDACDVMRKLHSTGGAFETKPMACYLPNTLLCFPDEFWRKDFSASDAGNALSYSPCKCKAPEVKNGQLTAYLGHHCQTTISFPFGPYYSGQELSYQIKTADKYPEANISAFVDLVPSKDTFIIEGFNYRLTSMPVLVDQQKKIITVLQQSQLAWVLAFEIQSDENQNENENDSFQNDPNDQNQNNQSVIPISPFSTLQAYPSGPRTGSYFDNIPFHWTFGPSLPAGPVTGKTTSQRFGSIVITEIEEHFTRATPQSFPCSIFRSDSTVTPRFDYQPSAPFGAKCGCGSSYSFGPSAGLPIPRRVPTQALLGPTCNLFIYPLSPALVGSLLGSFRINPLIPFQLGLEWAPGTSPAEVWSLRLSAGYDVGSAMVVSDWRTLSLPSPPTSTSTLQQSFLIPFAPVTFDEELPLILTLRRMKENVVAGSQTIFLSFNNSPLFVRSPPQFSPLGTSPLQQLGSWQYTLDDNGLGVRAKINIAKWHLTYSNPTQLLLSPGLPSFPISISRSGQSGETAYPTNELVAGQQYTWGLDTSPTGAAIWFSSPNPANSAYIMRIALIPAGTAEEPNKLYSYFNPTEFEFNSLHLSPIDPLADTHSLSFVVPQAPGLYHPVYLSISDPSPQNTLFSAVINVGHVVKIVNQATPVGSSCSAINGILGLNPLLVPTNPPSIIAPAQGQILPVLPGGCWSAGSGATLPPSPCLESSTMYSFLAAQQMSCQCRDGYYGADCSYQIIFSRKLLGAGGNLSLSFTVSRSGKALTSPVGMALHLYVGTGSDLTETNWFTPGSDITFDPVLDRFSTVIGNWQSGLAPPDYPYFIFSDSSTKTMFIIPTPVVPDDSCTLAMCNKVWTEECNEDLTCDCGYALQGDVAYATFGLKCQAFLRYLDQKSNTWRDFGASPDDVPSPDSLMTLVVDNSFVAVKSVLKLFIANRVIGRPSTTYEKTAVVSSFTFAPIDPASESFIKQMQFRQPDWYSLVREMGAQEWDDPVFWYALVPFTGTDPLSSMIRNSTPPVSPRHPDPIEVVTNHDDQKMSFNQAYRVLSKFQWNAPPRPDNFQDTNLATPTGARLVRFLLFVGTGIKEKIETEQNFDWSNGILLTVSGVDEINSTTPHSVWVPEALNAVTLHLPSFVTIEDEQHYTIVGHVAQNDESLANWRLFLFSYEFSLSDLLSEGPIGDYCSYRLPPCTIFHPTCSTGSVAVFTPQFGCVESTCPLKCPGKMVPSSDCLECICDTPSCLLTTRRFMLYLNPLSVAGANLVNDEMQLGFYHLLNLHLESALHLRPIDLPGVQFPFTESVRTRPISSLAGVFDPVNTNTALRGIIVTVTLTPTSTAPTTEIKIAAEISLRFAAIAFRLSLLFPLQTQPATPAFSSQALRLFAHNYFSPSFIKPAQTAQKFLPTLLPATSRLTAACEHRTDATIRGVCPSPTQVSTSPFWTDTCTTPQSTRQLKLLCVDLNNNAITGANWCKQTSFPALPLVTSIPCTAPPEPLTLSNPRVVKTPVQPGQQVDLAWTYTGPKTHTVAIWLDNVQDTTGHLSSSSSNSNSNSSGQDVYLLNHRLHLGTFPAAAGTVSVTLPWVISTFGGEGASSTFTVQIVQMASQKAVTQETFKIASYNPQCATTYWDHNTGRCSCKSGVLMVLDGSDPYGAGNSSAVCTCTQKCLNSIGMLTCSVPKPPDSAVCTCKSNFTGSDCTVCATQGNANPCNNGKPVIGSAGECPSSSTDDTQCECNANWTGPRCLTCSLPCDSIGGTVDGACSKCVCKRGYSGADCSVRSMLATLNYPGSIQISSIPEEVLTELKAMLALALGISAQAVTFQKATINNAPKSSSNVIHTVSFALDSSTDIEIDWDQLDGEESTPSLQLNLHRFHLSPTAQNHFAFAQNENKKENENETPFSILQSGSNPYTSFTYSIQSGTAADGSQFGQVSINDLYGAWGNLSNGEGMANSPIFNVGSDSGLGLPTAPPAYDPNCTNPALGCPAGTDPDASIIPTDGGKTAGTGAVVGIAVGVAVGSVALLLIAGLTVRWMYTNKRGCFAADTKSKGKDDAHLDLESGTEMSVATATQSHGTSKKSSKTQQSLTVSATADLEEVQHDEDLPSGWQKMKHKGNGEIFYVNSIEMKSQKHSPLDEPKNESGW